MDTELRTIGPCVEGSRNDQTADSQSEQTGGSLRHNNVEMLLHSIDSTEEEAHAHDQQQVRQHTPNERSLYDKDLLLHQCENGDDQLDSITRRVRV